MKPSIEKLRKFFRLEADRDYDNRAVMGGLESMLQAWEAEARVDQLPEGLVQAVVARLRDYGRLSPDSRKEALHGIWARVRRETGAEAVDVSAEKKRDTRPQREGKSRSETREASTENQDKSTSREKTDKSRPEQQRKQPEHKADPQAEKEKGQVKPEQQQKAGPSPAKTQS